MKIAICVGHNSRSKGAFSKFLNQTEFDYNKRVAEILKEMFTELGAEVELVESYDADPFDFEDFDICVVGTYTYGTDADLPDEIVDFYEELEDVDLADKTYGVFGSGDTFYVGKFCLCVDDFEKQFELTGATKGSEGVKKN